MKVVQDEENGTDVGERVECVPHGPNEPIARTCVRNRGKGGGGLGIVEGRLEDAHQRAPGTQNLLALTSSACADAIGNGLEKGSKGPKRPRSQRAITVKARRHRDTFAGDHEKLVLGRPSTDLE